MVDMVNVRLNFFYETLNWCGPYKVSWLLFQNICLKPGKTLDYLLYNLIVSV